MSIRATDYLYIALTVVGTVYGQLIVKWRVGGFGPLPDQPMAKLRFLISLLFDPMIFTGFAAAFLASLAWMAALTKFKLSHAYPFMSLNFVVVLLLSGWLLNEPVTAQRYFGVALIVLGTIVAARG
jgi:drug/metabolite transporter (DMT)-like permease